MIMNAIPQSLGILLKNNSRASSPPADAPIPTIGNSCFLLAGTFGLEGLSFGLVIVALTGSFFFSVFMRDAGFLLLPPFTADEVTVFFVFFFIGFTLWELLLSAEVWNETADSVTPFLEASHTEKLQPRRRIRGKKNKVQKV